MVIKTVLENLDQHKSPWPDNIPSKTATYTYLP